MATPNDLDRLLYAWRLLQTRVNSSIPSLTNRVKAARARLTGTTIPGAGR